MPKIKKPRKSKKMTYKQMMQAIIKPKKTDTDKDKHEDNKLKSISGLGGGKFQKLQRI